MECKYGVKTCKCCQCTRNAAFDDCNKGYCINCYECAIGNEPCHNVYLCTGFEERSEMPKDS